MAPQKRWSAMSPHELLDAAQAEYETRHGAGNLLTSGKSNAAILLQAAQVQAIASLEWTLENRVAPIIGSHP